ncbi:MAG TPA: hypothetical protein VFA07_03835 [Chthonomonadaceae bacterium]|nr:hypothetical protein [Chthonomonadaceae bacterium]
MVSSNPATVAVKLLDRKPPTVFNYAALKVLAGLRHHPYSHRTAFESVGAASGGHGFGRVHFFVETPPFLLDYPHPQVKNVALSEVKFNVEKARERGGIWVVLRPFARGVQVQIYPLQKDRQGWWKVEIHNLIRTIVESMPSQYVIAKMKFDTSDEVLMGITRFEPVPSIPARANMIQLLLAERQVGKDLIR